MDDKALEEKAFEFCEKSGCLHGASLTTLLREVADEAVEAHMDGCGRTTYNLAKSAERAEAEVERLKAEYAAAIERGMLATADLQGKVAEAEDLLLLAADAVEAEVERLRAALSWTVGGSGQRLPTPETVAAARPPEPAPL